MPAPSSAVAAIAACTRRIAVAAFVDGIARAMFVTAAAMACVLLGIRLLGRPAPPQWWWATALLPSLAFACWQVRRQRLAPGATAEHLDRRLQLHGLLLCAHDGVPIDAEWQQQLAVALQELPKVMPAVRWQQLWWRPLAALSVLAAVALLPANDDAAPAPQAAATAALQRLDEQLRQLEQLGQLAPEVDAELRQRLRELEQRLQDGDPSVWRALDEAGQKLERERLSQAAHEAPPATAPDGESLPVEQLVHAAELLAKTGLLNELAADAKDALQAAALGNGTFDPSRLPSDPATLRKLAEAIANAGLQIDPSKLLAAVSPEQVAELMRMAQGLARSLGAMDLRAAAELARQFGVGEGVQGTHGAQPGSHESAGGEAGGHAGESGASAGSPSRGPGRAALQLTSHTDGVAEKPLELPAGSAQPGEWAPSDPRRVDPAVQPTSNRLPGGQAAAGTGGATWQLRLAPRHRAVVQRFFDTASGGGK